LKTLNFKEGELKMKKLLVLLMVLGLVSSANAALSLSLSATTVAVGADVTLSVISDNGDGWLGDLVLSEDLVNWTAPIAAAYDGAVTILPAAGNLAALSMSQPNVAQISAGGLSPAPVAGTQFTVAIKGVQPGTIFIDLQDDSTFAEIAGPLTLTVTPEPITVALLGLGGLFLRRRK
jgi:hypothetical protein